MLSESQNIEYKESWRDEYLKWICGFANAQGGRIFIGVNDEKQVIGLPDAKKLMEDIPNKIVNYLGIVEDVNLLTEGEKEYIEIVVTPSSMPVAYRGVYHYRSGSTKQELKGLALQNFILKKMGWSWDDMPVAGATLNDIDRQAIDYFLRKGIEVGRISGDAYTSSTEAVLRSLNLITEEGQLKQAALLLFGKNPKRFFVSCDFRIGRFRNDESDLITQDVVEGNILQMVNRIIELLRSKYLLSPIHYEGITRIEQLEIPEDVLREAICNAIVHRDYMGVHTQMKVYDDCIMLWNDGKLPEGINQEKLFAEHASQPRNRNIANAFYKAGFIETWGRGINKIRQGLKKIGLPEPKIENHVSGTLITIYRNVGVNGTNNTNNVGNMSETNVGNMSETNLTERQRFILSSIKKNPLITGKEMSETLAVTQRTVERDLAAMQKAGIIRHEGKVNAGVWVVLEKPQKKD